MKDFDKPAEGVPDALTKFLRFRECQTLNEKPELSNSLKSGRSDLSQSAK